MIETRISTSRPATHHADAAILGQALFGDVETGHDLDARNQRFLDDLGGGEFFVQQAVDPETHQQVALVGFDMDIADPLLDRLGQDRVAAGG